MIGDALVDGTNQVRAGVRQAETEVTAGIGSGTGHFFHPLPERDQHHAVSGGRLTGGAIVNLSGEGLSAEECGECEKYAKNNNEARPNRHDGRSAALHTPFAVGLQILCLTFSNSEPIPEAVVVPMAPGSPPGLALS